MDGESVIFVGGCMRSGTTLLQRMLCASQGAHPFTDECQFLTALIDFLVAWGQRFDWLKDFYGTPEGYEAYAKATVDAFLRSSFETQAPARTVVLKNPELTVHFPRLADWYRKAKLLVVVRDPRDTIASILDVAQRHGEAGVPSQIARIGRDMTKLSHFYKAHYVDALQSPKCKNRVLVVKYEDLVNRPDAALAALSQHLGLTLRADLIPPDRFDRRTRDVNVAAFWTTLRAEPPSSASVGRHRHSLSSEEIAAIETHCADFNRGFQYW
jgi:sulfotransferase family protein